MSMRCRLQRLVNTTSCTVTMSDSGSAVELVQALRARPFSLWSYEEKCLAKNSRPMPHLDVQIVDGRQNRKFQDSWYVRYPWLTGCASTKNLFCYVCMLFGGENKWTWRGIPVTKNFVRMAEKHQGSKKHLQNEQNHSLLGRRRTEREGESRQQVLLLRRCHHHHHHCVKSRKVAGSIPDWAMGVFH